MEQHQYLFELTYKKMVKGNAEDFVIPITAINNCYVDAYNKVDEYVQKNFGDKVTTDSRIQYVGEFVYGKLIPFVEVKKENEEMRTKKKSYEVLEMEHGFLGRYVEQLKKSIDGWIEMNNAKDTEINRLEKRVKEFEEKQKELKAEYKGGYFDCKKMNPSSVYGFNLIPRGSGKQDFLMNYQQRVMEELLNRTCEFENPISKRISDAILKHETKVYDVNSMYPQAVDVCKVYQIERDQALKENDALMNKVSGYKKELGKLNLLMDDMENRLEKELIVRQGMNNQMKKWKAEMKRKNKIIDALTEDKDEK